MPPLQCIFLILMTLPGLPLPVGEVAERSEVGEGLKYGIPSQSASLTALPGGEPRRLTKLMTLPRGEAMAQLFCLTHYGGSRRCFL